MEKRFIYRLIAILFLILYFIGCDLKDSPTKSNLENSDWKIDNSFFRDSKIILNAKVSGDNFIIAGLNFVAVYDSNNSSNRTNGFAWSSKALDHKPVISSPYIMYGGENDVQFYLNSPLYHDCFDNQCSYPFAWACKLDDYEPSYSKKAIIPVDYFTRPIGAFNNQNQLLTVIDDTCSNGNNYSFCLVDLNSCDNNDIWGDDYCLSLSPTIRRIQIEDKTYQYLSYIGSFDGKFYVCFGSKLYIIESNGQMKLANGIFFRINEVFSYNDVLYAVNAYENNIYYSTNQGYDWQPTDIKMPSRFVKFFKIDNNLCFYVYSQLATLNIETGEIKELDNTGLEGNEITSVNKYDNKIWVSTLSGMYIKKYEDFFIYKENE